MLSKNLKAYDPYLVLILILFIFIFSSCDQGVNVEKKDNHQKNTFTITSINKTSVKKMVTKWKKNITKNNKIHVFAGKTANSNSDKINLDKFNLNNLELVKRKGQSARTIVAHEFNYNKQQRVNYYLALYKHADGNKILDSFIIRYKNISNSVKKITYFGLNGNKIFEAKVNKATKDIDIIYPATDKNIEGNKLSKARLFASKKKGCGQKVADCIADQYTNHGWKSVAAWVITAFEPEFGAGIAAGCALHECASVG